MTDNKVKLNDDKAEVSIIYPSRLLSSLSVPDSFAAGNTSVLFSDTISNLGERRRISSIRHHLTTEATATLVSPIILSRLDYCTVTLSFLPAHKPCFSCVCVRVRACVHVRV